MEHLKDRLAAVVAACLSIGGIALLFVGTYLTGFGWRGVGSVVAGAVLFVVGVIILRRQDAEIADRLGRWIRELLLST